MKLSRDAKVEKLVSKKIEERILSAPWLDIDRGVLLSSPGQSCVMIPVEVEPDDLSGPVPIEAVKAARKIKGAEIKCGEQYCVVEGVAYPRSNQWSAFPPVERLMTTPEHYIEISLNARLLVELAAACGTEVVRLRIARDDERAPFVVVPHPSEPHVDGAMGALLPYRVVRV